MTTARRPWAHLVRNLELYLTAAGLLVSFTVPTALHLSGWWSGVAVTALLVGVIHGMIFWVVRRRQRAVRQELIVELRHMLQDRVNNQLTVIIAGVGSANQDEREQLEDVAEAARTVSRTLDELSIESLSRWQARYPVRARAVQPAGA